MDRGETEVLPLQGVRVIDFTQVMLGPCCTQVLGESGADVIKVEREKVGDLSRWSIGEDPDGLNNPVFTSLNRNKRSFTVNLKSDEGRSIVQRLIDGADVVVNNFRPGIMESGNAIVERLPFCRVKRSSLNVPRDFLPP